MWSYDRNYTPPAVVVPVEVLHPTSAASAGPVSGKLDTGANITVLPQSLVTGLQLRPRARGWTRSFDASYSHRSVYYARMVVEGLDLPAVRCVAAARSDVLLGRNVLNHFVIKLDGPALLFELRQS